MSLYKDDDLIAETLTLTADSLRGRQSVRVTFRLSSQTINLLSLAAGQLGLKQKSLFDQLVEDRYMLDKAASEEKQQAATAIDRVQKTYVISRSSLETLQVIAQRHNISRDILVEWSINRLRPIMSAEHEKHQRWQQLRAKIEKLAEDGIQLIEDAEKRLENDDQLNVKLKETIDTLQKNCQEIRAIIDKGDRLKQLEEHFQPFASSTY